MRPKNKTKKQNKKERRTKLIIVFLILIFTLISLVLLYKIIFFKKPLFISPVSNIGFQKNSDLEVKLKRANIVYKNLKISGNIYEFDVADEGQVYMTSSKSIDDQISSLQLILKRIKIEGKVFKSLDFRYDTPVISF